MEIQERDTNIIHFIEQFKVTTIKLTSSLFFPGKTLEPCRRRLQLLVKNKYINLGYKEYGREYSFYPRGCRNFSLAEEQRRLAITRFYVELVQATNKGILSYETYTKADYAPFDLIVYFVYRNKRYLAFVNASLYKKYPKDKIIKWYNDSKLFKQYIETHYSQLDNFMFVNIVDRNVNQRKIQQDKKFNLTELDVQSHEFLKPLLGKLKDEERIPVLRKVITKTDLMSSLSSKTF